MFKHRNTQRRGFGVAIVTTAALGSMLIQPTLAAGESNGPSSTGPAKNYSSQHLIEAIKLSMYRFVPVGTVLEFAGDTAPPGWLACDGHEEKRSSYPKLSEILKTNWGAAIDSESFKLPDHKNRFVAVSPTTASPAAPGTDTSSAGNAPTPGYKAIIIIKADASK